MENTLETEIFKERFFPNTTSSDWNDWQWQFRNRITTFQALRKIINLNEDEIVVQNYHRDRAIARNLPLSITPYYASLINPDNPDQPLRRAVIPVKDEYIQSYGESADPLCEDDHRPVPGIVHNYPDRALFLATNVCAVSCRYCTRSRIVGAQNEKRFNISDWENAIAYVESNSNIRDVLISGGDPLTLSDEQLDWLLGRLRRIPHLEFLRIGTKIPVVLPQRITPELLKILKRNHPLWMSIHFMHPDELTPEVAIACNALADAGIPLGSQTVLLKGINDNVETMKKLMHGLLRLRVKPYYLYQCDPLIGSLHFRTSVKTGIKIIEGLRGHTSGYAVPTFVVDSPGGKIPLLPEYFVQREGDEILLRNYKNKLYRYPDVSK